MAFEIIYPGTWSSRMHASRVAAEIQETTGEPVQLKKGGLWTFDVLRDGEVIWSITQPGIFPVPGELRNLLAER